MHIPPLILQAAFIAGLFGVLGVVLTRSVAAGQLRVQQQTLFVTMLPRRVEWQDAFRKAVAAWDGLMQTIINYEGYDPPEPVALFELHRLHREAAWLFGSDAYTAAGDIIDQLDRVRELRIDARSGGDKSFESAQQVSSAVIRVYELFDPLGEAIKSKLYVGDIKRSVKDMSI